MQNQKKCVTNCILLVKFNPNAVKRGRGRPRKDSLASNISNPHNSSFLEEGKTNNYCYYYSTTTLTNLCFANNKFKSIKKIKIINDINKTYSNYALLKKIYTYKQMLTFLCKTFLNTIYFFTLIVLFFW